MTSDLTPPSQYVEPSLFADPAHIEPPLTGEATSDARPRIRWAGIVWGTFFAAVSGVMLWALLTAAAQRDAVRDWILALSPTSVAPGTVAAFSLLTLGVLMLVGGAVALLRRAQVRAAVDH